MKCFLCLIFVLGIITYGFKSDGNRIKPDLPNSQNKKKKEKHDIVKIETKYGDIFIYLYDLTPKHKENFLKLVKEKFYDGTTFHRVIKNFVIQGGDPNSKGSDPKNIGQGGPAYTIEPEILGCLNHVYGAVAAARDNNPEKRSNGSQFYIVVEKDGAHSLDNNYTVFGEVISGMDVAEKIANTPTDGANNMPLEDIVMKARVEYDFKFDQRQLQYYNISTKEPIRTEAPIKDTSKSKFNENFDEQAVPPGGMKEYYKFLAENIKYPNDAIDANAQGTVQVRLYIDQSGKIVDARINKDDVGYGCPEEALKVILSMPPWKPGKINGHPVPTTFLVPVKFVLH